MGDLDQKTFVEQLGLQVLALPADEAPMRWGTSVRTELGVTAVPGALTMTWIDVVSEAEQTEVQQRTSGILEGLAAEPGFIGFVGSFSGGRGHPMSAWTSPEAAESAMARSLLHRSAIERPHAGLGVRGFTSIWAPHRLNVQIVHCPQCDSRREIPPGTATARCDCGTEVVAGSYL